MDPVRLASLEDPRIDDYRNLKDATLARTRDRFVVEGRGNLRVLLGDSPMRPESLLLSERAWGAMRGEIEAAGPDCPVYLADQALLDGIVGFPIHRGALGVCRRPPAVAPLALAREALAREAAPRLVVLEGLIDHDNVGGIFRNAFAFGAAGIVLCPRTCDPLYRKAIRTSMGGSLCVPFARSAALGETLEDLRTEGFRVVALDPAPAGHDVATLEPSTLGPVALVVGTEGAGITPATLAAADLRVRIGMAPGVDSLNVSVAAAIALHRLRDHDSDA